MVTKYNSKELAKLRHADLLSIAVEEKLVSSNEGQSLSRAQLQKLILTVKEEVNPPFAKEASEVENIETPVSEETSEVENIETPVSEEISESDFKPSVIQSVVAHQEEVNPVPQKKRISRQAFENALKERMKSESTSSFQAELDKRLGKKVSGHSLDEELKIRKNKYQI